MAPHASSVGSWLTCAGLVLAGPVLAGLGCGVADGVEPGAGAGQWPLVDCALPEPDGDPPGILVTVQQTLRGARLIGMGDLDGGEQLSEARGVDATGARVVGIGTSAAGTHAVAWSAGTGLVPLADAPSTASAIDGAGCVVAGSALALIRPEDERIMAARWVGMQPVEQVPAPVHLYRRSEAVAVSGDGLSIAGRGYQDLLPSGFVWRGNEFSNRPPDNLENLGLNADGSVVVGRMTPSRSGGPAYAVRNGQQLPYPFVADPACTTGACEPCLTPGQCAASAHGVSADGRIVVGSALQSGTASGSVAVSWVISGDQVSVQLLSTAAAEARAVSADGRVVVGSEAPSGQLRAVRWVDGRATSISAALAAAGVSVGGWQLTRALGVSADGETIVGAGLNPEGHPEGWIARLPVR